MSENIIWTVEGTIKDGQRGALETLMREMGPIGGFAR